jgi:ATP-dependent helicase HepA
MSRFTVGQLVEARTGGIGVVVSVRDTNKESSYQVFLNGKAQPFYESQLAPAPTDSNKQEALSERDLHAHLTSLHILSPSTANLFSLRSGRVRFVPYQYRPVLKLVHADRPRLLIADEVGVGKTIEAGLIIKELRARLEIKSVLVICPKALVAERKWLNEMKRFDEHFTALDGALLRHCLRETHLEGEWPEQYAKAIVPFSLFDADLIFGSSSRNKDKDRGLLALDPAPKFDLVIVDEAHHIRNSETFLHQGVRYFCDSADAVVLLTATPVQLGSEDLFTLLNVLRPDLVIDHASFEHMAQPNRYINNAVEHCRAAKSGWQREAYNTLGEVERTVWGRLFIAEGPDFREIRHRLERDTIGSTERVDLIHKIEELYTFGTLINRTRRRDIGEFTTRKPETFSIEFTPEQKHLHDGLLAVVERILARCHGQQNVKFMMTTIRRQAASCIYGLAPLLSDILNGKLDRLELIESIDDENESDFAFVSQMHDDIEELFGRACALSSQDPKVNAFINVLREKSTRTNNKTLVFSTFRHTLTYLHMHAERAGLRVGLIHGDVPDDDRMQLRNRFARPKEHEEAIDVLLSSEVGCEGLDFQFCDLLVNYDLQWNPMRIEQRIGRIDRFGQESETVAIINFITPDTVDADIYQRCLSRIGLFQRAVGGSEEILGAITRELHDIAENFNLSAKERATRLQQLADNGIRQIREEQELEHRQSDLFGLSVPNRSWRAELEAAESFWLSPAALQGCVSAYLSKRLKSDLDHILGDRALRTLRLSQEARAILLKDYRALPHSAEPDAREWEKWLKGTQSTLVITFDQQAAAENPGTAYLSILHPLVRQAARYLEITEARYVALSAQSSHIGTGIYHFALYRWAKHGVKPDDQLVAVADDPELEASLFDILRVASGGDPSAAPNPQDSNSLDARHYTKWADAQAKHIANNRHLIEHRIQSLTASHNARCKVIRDQITRSTNEKIRVMKESELARAKADFDRRINDLREAGETGDIQARPVVFGTLTINGGSLS